MKNGIVTFDDIGRVAYAYFKADIERFNARKQRQIARASHQCEGEKMVFHYGIPEPEVQPSLCWQDNPDFNEWCENCKYVQPFHEEFIRAVKRVKVLKSQLTRFCKAKQWNDSY